MWLSKGESLLLANKKKVVLRGNSGKNDMHGISSNILPTSKLYLQILLVLTSSNERESQACQHVNFVSVEQNAKKTKSLKSAGPFWNHLKWLCCSPLKVQDLTSQKVPKHKQKHILGKLKLWNIFWQQCLYFRSMNKTIPFQGSKHPPHVVCFLHKTWILFSFYRAKG